MTTVFLSRPLRVGMPLYGGRDSFRMEKDGDLSRGDTANSLKISFSNHAGTHFDFPRHVQADGKTLDDYPAEDFIFTRPAALNIKLSKSRYITAEDLRAANPPPGADLILIKTDTPYNGEEYWRENPGLGPTAAEFLKNLSPPPRCVGLDFISVNSWPNRDPGRIAHRILLAEPAILILEDLDLSPLNQPGARLLKVTAAPLRLARADGTPAVVLGEIG